MAELFDLRQLLDYKELTEGYMAWGRSGAPNPLFEFYTNMPTAAPPPVEGEQPLTGSGGSVTTQSDGSTTTAQGLPQYSTDEVEFIKIGRVKDPAPANSRGNPARILQPTGKEKRKLAMLNCFNAITLGMDVMQMLREPDNHVLQQRGRTEISQQFEDFATRHKVLKQVYVSKFLTGGAVYLDANGDVLESSSGSVVTINTGIPSANQSQIAETNFGMGGSNIIAAAWDLAGTKILTQLDRLNEAAEYQNTEPLRHIWIHRSNKWWLRENTEILAFYNAGKERLDRDLQADTFEINNYVFHFYGGTYTAQDGTTSYFVPKTKAIITPEPGPWLAQGVGLQLVPMSLDIKGTIDEVVGAWQEHWGDFAYMLNQHNPPSLEMFMGFNWLFGFKNPSSVFCPTVDF